MEFDVFLETIKKKVELALGRGYTLHCSRVRKNNGVSYHGIIIRRGKEQVCPTVYLDRYYEAFCQGESMEKITEAVLQQYRSAVACHISSGLDLSYEKIREKIVYRLVNREKNQELLEECPITGFLDLAVTYHILLDGISEKEQASIRITKEMMEMWGIDIKELSELAEENTKRCLPPVFCSMREILGRLMLEETQRKELEAGFGEGEKGNGSGDIEELAMKMMEGQELYVLTNKKSLYGAAAVLYEGLVAELSEKMDTDLYLLPSSVHEFILVPAEIGLKKEELMEMVRSVNDTQLPKEDFLSDFIYYYCRKKEKFQKL